MKPVWIKFIALGLSVAAILPLPGGARSPSSSPHTGLTLWAWERPEDLRTIGPQDSVAYLVETIFLRKQGIIVRPRRQPMALPAGTKVIAVVRVEAAPSAELSTSQEIPMAATVAAVAQDVRVNGLQIDFDATASQRGFYRALLIDLRQRLGKEQWIGITALTSWCMHDDWISDLPVNEAVPMLFSMGKGRAETLAFLAAGHDFTSELCRHSVGLRLGDPAVLIPHHRSIYLFSDRPWNADLVRAAEIERRELQ